MIRKEVFTFLVFWAFSASTLFAQSAPSILSSPVTEARIGDAYVYDVDASGLPAPTYALELAPSDMSIEAETGIIAWAPTTAGDFAVKVVASNISGQVSQEFSIHVAAGEAPVITSAPVTEAFVNQDYAYDVEATGDPEPDFALALAPPGMTIEAKTGLITWTPTVEGVVTVSVTATNESGSASQDFAISVISQNVEPTITSSPITLGTAGSLYTYDVEATGTPTPTYSLSKGPLSMTIDESSGLVSWTPESAGMYEVEVNAINDAGTDTQNFTISVGDAKTPPVITSTALTTATIGQDYSYDVDATGNPIPSYSLAEAPEGMSIDENTGLITWTPQTTGEYRVVVVAENDAGSTSQEFAITVSEQLVAPTITSTPSTQGTVNQLYRYVAAATGNPKPTITLSESPVGMSINASGVIRWTPQSPGDFNVVVTATNSVGSDTQEFTISISEQPVAPVITSSPISQGTVGETYIYDVEAGGNPAPTFTLTQSPEGMGIDAATGQVTWAPGSTGGFTVGIQAQNSVGADLQEFTLTISEQQYEPVFTSSPSTQAFVNQEYSYVVSADANPGAGFSLIKAPASMSINAITGEITWTPTQIGSFEVSVQASNALGSAVQEYALTVSMDFAAPTIVSSPITQALVSIEYNYEVNAVGNPMPTFVLTESPADMSIDAESGMITWTPRTPGNFKVTVEAQNSQGSFTQSFNVLVGILGSVPLVQLETVQVVSANSLNLRAFTNANGSTTQVAFEYGQNAVDEFRVVASPETIEGFEDVEVIARLSDLDEGKVYLFRAIAENNVGQIVSPTRTFTTYRSSYQIGASRPFSEPVDSLKYRLFSIPGDVDIDVSETLQGTQGQDWGVYADNGAPANFFKAYDGSDRFHFQPGRGFWVLSRTNWVVEDQTVNTVPLDPSGVYQIPLQAGWNIISSPYLVTVPWAQVRNISPSAPPTAKIWSFNGAFREANSLEPYQAYYYFHDGEEEASLSIPFPGLRPNASKTAAAKTNASKLSGNGSDAAHLVLEATGFDSLYAAAEILIDAGADREKDRFDQYAPRAAFSTLGLLIEPAFDAPYGHMALEARPDIQDGAVFDLVLDAKPGERIDLTVNGLEGFFDEEVYLVDAVTGEFTNLHEQAGITVYPTARRTKYRLVIGSESFVEAQRSQLAPETILLQQNFPNPFAGTTTISYSLTESEYVDLTVYDVLGREVQTLVSGVQPAGFHQVVWGEASGASLPEGVYMLRMKTESGQNHVVSMTKVR